MILFIRADSTEVLVELTKHNKVLASKKWQVGRELSGQIHQVIESLCAQSGNLLKNIEGIVVYEGPGSYTGLRISISVVNALGYSLNLPVVGATGEDWKQQGLSKLALTTEFIPISPTYGGQVYTTQPKK